MTRRPIQHRPVPETDKGDNWRAKAACLEADPETFFPEKEGRSGQVRDQMREEAKAYCARCPVVGDCRAYGDAVEGSSQAIFGVLGDETIDERLSRRRRAKRMARA